MPPTFLRKSGGVDCPPLMRDWGGGERPRCPFPLSTITVGDPHSSDLALRFQAQHRISKELRCSLCFPSPNKITPHHLSSTSY